MLTNSERRVVEENHNLIYKFIHDKELELQEYYGLIAESLCKAVMSWDEEKGALSTLFYKIASRDLYRYWRTQSTKKRKSEGELSLNDVNLESEYNLENELITKEIITNIQNSKYAEIFNLRYKGLTQTEIAEIIGVSQVEISRRLKKMGEKYFDRT